MIKKNLKLFTIILIVLTVISSFSLCFADETNETATSVESTGVVAEKTNEEIHKGDLYLFDANIEMNQLVDGNVYLMGNDITVSGQINGNLFVFGNSIKFDNCYVRYSIYACANNIYYNGACNDLYAMTQKLEMTYDSYVVRDVKALSNNTIFKAAIGRDVDLQTNSIDFGADNEVPVIYGNLRYSANEEKNLADGIVEGEINYSPNTIITSNKSAIENVIDIAITFLTVVATTLVIYALTAKFLPNYIESISKFNIINILKACGIGLLTFVVGIIATVLLLASSIGAKLAFILILALILVGLFAMPIVTIFITNLLKPILKIEKTVLYYVVLALVSIVLYGLTLIPFVGWLIKLILFFVGYGLIVLNILPKKDLSEEEIQKKLADKEAKKALKEAKKTEKAELKEAKKAEKAKLKETKKAEKTEK